MNANEYPWKPIAAGAVLLLLAGATVLPSSDAEEGAAEGGSPLYEIVVADSVTRLAGTGRARAQEAAARQPCPHCGQIHGAPRQAAEDADGAIGHGILAEGTSPAGHHSRPDAATRAERTPRYVYCANCRVYHAQPSHDTEPDAALPHE